MLLNAYFIPFPEIVSFFQIPASSTFPVLLFVLQTKNYDNKETQKGEMFMNKHIFSFNIKSKRKYVLTFH